jgi:hypothetical protein
MQKLLGVDVKAVKLLRREEWGDFLKENFEDLADGFFYVGDTSGIEVLPSGVILVTHYPDIDTPVCTEFTDMFSALTFISDNSL